jgi:hypothetical protein
MRALYTLVARARTVYALGQTAVTFVRVGPSALAPVQLLFLACGLCLILGTLAPTPRPGDRRAILLDRVCGVMAAGAVIGLIFSDAVSACLFLGRLARGV